MSTERAPALRLELLRRVSLFQSAPESDLAALAAMACDVEVGAGETLFHAGDPGETLYVVASGLLEAVLDECSPAERPVASFWTGDVIGEMAILTGERRSASVRAATDSTLMAFARYYFLRLLDRAAGVAVSLSRTLSRRLSATDAALSGHGPTIALVAVLGDRDSRGALLKALRASAERQTGAATALAVLDGSPRDPVSAGVAPVGPASAEACDLDDAALLSRLRATARRDGHVLVWSTPTEALARLPLVRHADRVVLVDATEGDPVALRVMEDLRRVRSTVRLAYLARPGAPLPPSAREAAAPLRLLCEPENGWWSPRAGDVDRLVRHLLRRSVGIALSGGAAQGVAHLGVLEALLDGGIPIDVIAGTSGGALYGSLVASGLPVRLAQDRVIQHTRHNLNDRADPVIPTRGLIRGARIERMIRDVLGDVVFEELAIPACAVAADLDSGEEVILNHGPVYRAVRASISVPGVFEPYRLDGRLLVDGGVVNPLPVSVARREGADFVLAVQVPPPGKGPERGGGHVSRQLRGGHNLLSTMVRTYYFAGDVLASRSAAEADLLIRPDVAHFGWRDYRSAPAIIQEGRVAGNAILPGLRARMAWPRSEAL